MKKTTFVFSLLGLCVFLVAGWHTENGKLILSSDSTEVSSKSITVALTEEQKGGTAPTVATKGTTPTVHGLLFDAANELYQIQFHVPDDWDGASDVEVGLMCVLNQIEAADDVIDWTADYVSTTDGVDAADKASTNITTTETILAGCAGDGCVYHATFTLAYDDADNPFAVDDFVVVEIHRTDLANCGGVIVTGADVHYNAKI